MLASILVWRLPLCIRCGHEGVENWSYPLLFDKNGDNACWKHARRESRKILKAMCEKV